ncbi:hypothetical protein D3C86_1672930 [compost metagenome]
MGIDHHIFNKCGNFPVGQTAAQTACQFAVRHIRQPAAHVVGEGWAEAIIRDLCFQKPGFSVCNIKRLGNQIG